MLVHIKFNFLLSSPRNLHTKNGYVSNFYEKLAKDLIVQNDKFRMSFMLVHIKFDFN